MGREEKEKEGKELKGRRGKKGIIERRKKGMK